MNLAQKALFHAKGVFAHELEIVERSTHSNRYVFKLLPIDRAWKPNPNYVYVTFLRAVKCNVQGGKKKPLIDLNGQVIKGDDKDTGVTTCIISYKDKCYTIDVRPYTVYKPVKRNGKSSYDSNKVNYYDARRIVESYYWDDPDNDIPFYYDRPRVEWKTDGTEVLA